LRHFSCHSERELPEGAASWSLERVVESLLPGSFEGVPVEFSVTDVINLTTSGGGYGN
jgi:hypothetical protein